MSRPLFELARHLSPSERAAKRVRAESARTGADVLLESGTDAFPIKETHIRHGDMVSVDDRSLPGDSVIILRRSNGRVGARYTHGETPARFRKATGK